MALQDMARAAYAQIRDTLAPNASVAVVCGGVTTTGIIDTSRNEDQLEQAGVAGQKRGIVRCSAAAVTVDRGDVITVAGVKCQVDQVRIDPVGALKTIDYTELQ